MRRPPARESDRLKTGLPWRDYRCGTVRESHPTSTNNRGRALYSRIFFRQVDNAKEHGLQTRQW